MISAGEFRNGVTIEYEGDIFIILEFQHVKPGKGAAFVRTKLKNIINTYLHGFQKSMQTSRTVYFRFNFDNNSRQIYAGIFDIENQKVLNSRLILSKNSSILFSTLYSKNISHVSDYVKKFIE